LEGSTASWYWLEPDGGFCKFYTGPSARKAVKGYAYVAVENGNGPNAGWSEIVDMSASRFKLEELAFVAGFWVRNDSAGIGPYPPSYLPVAGRFQVIDSATWTFLNRWLFKTFYCQL